MGASEIEYVAGAIAAEIIRNQDLKSPEAAAKVYFECLDALKAAEKRRKEQSPDESGEQQHKEPPKKEPGPFDRMK